MVSYIKAKSIILADSEKVDAYLKITDDGQFGHIITEKPDGNIIDYSDYHIAPGLVDTHIHGYASHDVMANVSFWKGHSLQKNTRALKILSI